MPSVTDRQRRFMGAELGRKRAGLATKTGMSEGQLKDFASAVKPNKPNKPAAASKPAGGGIGFKRRKPKKLGLPNTGVGGFNMAVKTPGIGGRF